MKKGYFEQATEPDNQVDERYQTKKQSDLLTRNININEYQKNARIKEENKVKKENLIDDISEDSNKNLIFKGPLINKEGLIKDSATKSNNIFQSGLENEKTRRTQQATVSPKPSLANNTNLNINNNNDNPDIRNLEKNENKIQVMEVPEKKPKKIKGKIYLFLVLCVLIEQYYAYVFLVESPKLTYYSFLSLKTLRITLFSILFILVLSALFITCKINPGSIPIYWGFYIGDEDFKKKRYCLICNVFKPDRTHHCSICGTCVLNMDHHCPWINNCIGFYNKKYFIQLLFYINLSLFYLDFAYLPTTIYIISGLINRKLNLVLPIQIVKITVILLNHVFVLVLTYFIFFFFKFHLKLLFNNYTTIESLDPEFVKKNKYDLGYKENFIQVFGRNPWLWFIPVVSNSGFPKGDGLTWEVNELGIKMFQTNENKEKDSDKDKTNNNLSIKDTGTTYSSSGYNSNNNLLTNNNSENNFHKKNNNSKIEEEKNNESSIVDNSE